MKRTLIISLEYPPIIGGIATYVDQLATSLPKEHILVLAPKHKNSQQWDDARPYKIIRKNLYYPVFVWPRWMRLFFQVRKIVKEYNIEMIHVHHVLPVGYVAFLIQRFYHVPYIIFSHGTDIAAAYSKRWKRKMASMVSKKATHIFTNSENLRLRLVNKFSELSDMTTVLYPCPDTEYFTPPSAEQIQFLRQKYALEGKKVLLSISRLDDGKGFPHLIRVMPKILKRFPSLVWFIVGDGPKKNEVISLIRKNNLQNIVRFIGEVPHAELKQYYHLADIFVLLTHPDNGKEEGLGLVFLEAATAGLPIVAGRSGGVGEAVLDKKTGLVVNIKQNPQAIVDSVVKFLEDPIYAAKLGAAGQERIRKEFQWDNQVKHIQEWL
jgi:phosphatidyl-myo-inositol dimannoside synthase